MLAMLVQAWVCAHACACTGPVPLAGARESVAGRVAAARLVHPLRQDVQRGFVLRVPGPNRPSAWSSSPRPCPPGSSLECLRCLVQVECDLKVDRDIRQKRRRTETRRSFRKTPQAQKPGRGAFLSGGRQRAEPAWLGAATQAGVLGPTRWPPQGWSLTRAFSRCPPFPSPVDRVWVGGQPGVHLEPPDEGGGAEAAGTHR